MRRITIILFIAALLMCTGGCADIDWKGQAKRFFADLLETAMINAIAEYGGSKMECVAWTIKYVEQEKYDWARPVMKWIKYEELIEHAYDRLWAEWYGLLREAEYDTDAMIARKPKVFALMSKGVVCEGLQDELVAMME